MYEMSDEEFEQVVEEALDELPAQFIDALENIAITVADEPEPWQLDAVRDDEHPAGVAYEGELLGLFDGLSLEERADGFEGDVPDVITIFKGPHERAFHTHAEEVEQVKKTVIHEIGHYFGLDDAKLHAMGY